MLYPSFDLALCLGNGRNKVSPLAVVAVAVVVFCFGACVQGGHARLLLLLLLLCLLSPSLLLLQQLQLWHQVREPEVVEVQTRQMISPVKC